MILVGSNDIPNMTKYVRAGLWPIFVITMISMVCAFVQSMGNARADVATEYTLCPVV